MFHSSLRPFIYRFRFLGSLFTALAVVILFSSYGSLAGHFTYHELAGEAAFSPAVSYHHLQLRSNNITYKATSGYLTIKDQHENSLADIYYTAYDQQDQHAGNRPITFVFNGGPGSASIWLHMGALGPERVEIGKNGYNDNPNSWLSFTDLVFIDPVGTGYSQAAVGVDARRFHSYNEDIRSIAAFIKQYLATNNRRANPIFLAGESYGAARAVGLAAYLQDSLQINLSGLTLISPALNYKLISFRKDNDAPYAYYLPTYALAAQYYNRLLPELQKLSPEDLMTKVNNFSRTTYAQFLKTKGKAPSQLIDTLSYYTGLSKIALIEANGRITDSRFIRTLLHDHNKIIGTFDSRITGVNENADPSETIAYALFTSSFQNYVHNELGYQNHLPYMATTNISDWNYEAEATGGYLNISRTLKELIEKHKNLKVAVDCGYYDLATPVATSDYVINHLGIDKKLRGNIKRNYYNSGHMIYLNNNANTKFHEDGALFYDQTLHTNSEI